MISVGQAAKVYENLGEEIQLYINEEKGGKLNRFIGIVDKGKELFSRIYDFWNKKDKKAKDKEENENIENYDDIYRTHSNKSKDSFGSNDSNSDEDKKRGSSLGSDKRSSNLSNEEANELDY